jgi:hypothetical protein
MYLCISNNGEIDPRAFSLLGASSKRDESESIGFFGSGAKYALAVLLREDKRFRVFSGEKEIIFTAHVEQFRDKIVSVIHVDGRPTSLTIETGPKWTLHHALRELYSNAIDEENGQWNLVEHVLDAPGRTAIYVEADDDIKAIWKARHKYFITPEAKPLWEHEGVQCFDPKDTGNIANFYRRGVWCCEERHIEPRFSYNIHDISLNESRVTSPETCSQAISDALFWCPDENFIKKMLFEHADKPYAEWGALYYYQSGPSPAWREPFEESFDYYATESDVPRFAQKDLAKVKIVNERAASFLKQAGVKGLSDYQAAQSPYEIQAWPPGDFETRVYNAVYKLRNNGLKYVWDTHYVSFRRTDLIAMADMTNLCILLGHEALKLDDKRLLKALIEEHIHLDRKVLDHSIEQQHAYLDIIIGLLK